MISFNFQNNCSGCGACANVCPTHAIRMCSDKEGFPTPLVFSEICISCGKCDAVCPHLNHDKTTGKVEDVRAVWLYSSSDEDVKMKSSSGAACYELSKSILKSGGCVVGCAWDQSLVARHMVVSSIENLTRLQGSKYVQSETGNVYSEAIELLKEGRRVLFTGTPCQATAMHNTVSNLKLRENLITVAVLCHGVASPTAWESYKQYAALKEGSPLVHVNFRDKSKEGYKKSYCCYEYADGRSTYLPTFLPPNISKLLSYITWRSEIAARIVTVKV